MVHTVHRGEVVRFLYVHVDKGKVVDQMSTKVHDRWVGGQNRSKIGPLSLWTTPFSKISIFNLFATSKPPKYSNSNYPNLLLWFFCLIKSRANWSGIIQPFLNPNLIFFSNVPQIVCHRIIKKNQNKDLENSNLNILEVPMSRTSYLKCCYFATLWQGILKNRF